MYLSEEGCLLRKSPSGETFILLVFFLRDSGLLNVLARRSSAGNLPDLFTSGTLYASRRRPSGPAFFQDFERLQGFESIGRSYGALSWASFLGRFYELNLVHMESFSEAWAILHQALRALATKPLPEATVLKACYLLARTEGYPVRSQWLESRPEADRLALTGILRRPAEAIDTSPAEVKRWLQELAAFLRESTDLVVPGP
jgi:recombinational DNA repair protein (RecF pathway)